MMKRRFSQTAVVLVIAVGTVAGRTSAHPGLHHEIETVTRQLDRAPDRVESLIERGRLYRLDDNASASHTDLERARVLDSDNDVIALELGLTLSAMGRDAEGEVQLTRYIQRGGRASDAYAERARIRSHDNRAESAIDDYSVAIDRSGDLDQYLARGILQERLGRLDEAASGYRDGLDRSGGSVALRLALIRVQIARTRYDDALSLIEEVTAQSRVKTQWYLRRADVLEAAGRADDARAERQRALAEAERVLARRRTAINLVARARVCVAMGRLEQAGLDLVEAIEKSPRFGAARSLLNEVEHRRRSSAGGGR